MKEQHKSHSGHRRHGLGNRWWAELSFVVKATLNSILDWWSRDQIRIAPTAGRLLGLKSNNCILLRGRLFSVQEVRDSINSGAIVFTLVGDSEQAILSIERGENGCATGGCLELAGQSEFVFDDDVFVISKADLLVKPVVASRRLGRA